MKRPMTSPCDGGLDLLGDDHLDAVVGGLARGVQRPGDLVVVGDRDRAEAAVARGRPAAAPPASRSRASGPCACAGRRRSASRPSQPPRGPPGRPRPSWRRAASRSYTASTSPATCVQSSRARSGAAARAQPVAQLRVADRCARAGRRARRRRRRRRAARPRRRRRPPRRRARRETTGTAPARDRAQHEPGRGRLALGGGDHDVGGGEHLVDGRVLLRQHLHATAQAASASAEAGATPPGA